MFKIAVLVSGNGSNLQAIIDAIKHRKIRAKIVMVISSAKNAYALERAKLNKIPTYVVSKTEFNDTSDEILKLVRQAKVDLIVLAGYLNILRNDILVEYKKRIINIHPSLLPKYGGIGMYGHHVHEAVLRNKEKETGVTVHYVSEKIDGGDIIFQIKVPVLNGDDINSLSKRVLIQEHKILPVAIKKIITT